MAAQSLTLYELESHLLALADMVETVDPEHEAEFIEEFTRALLATVAKRDAVGQFLTHLDSQAALVDAEVKRLRDRQSGIEKVRDRLEAYVHRAIEALGFDESGRYKKLAGNFTTFSLCACPASVEITDMAAVPDEYKSVLVKMPAAVWASIKAQLDPDLVKNQIALHGVSADKRAIKAELDGGWEIDGADLAIGKYRLERK